MNDIIKGRVHGVSGPTVIASGMQGARMHTTAHVGRDGLLAEVIRIDGGFATLQVYEDTTGLKPGEDVVSQSKPLTVVLGPGLIGGVFDGIQRPLEAMASSGSAFIRRGEKALPVDRSASWNFGALKKKGDMVFPGDVIGETRETEGMVHRIMAPYGVSGTIAEIRDGVVGADEPVAVLEGGGNIHLYHEWPVRLPRPFKERKAPTRPFVTGQRVFDTLFPVAEGGTAILPGGFGTGKTVVEQTLAKYASADIVIYIGCGERGNEMTEVLSDFPRLKDPRTGRPLSERTVVIVNTSNMPVAAREASIFTGVTIAEYYRDMGYRVALMSDSLSRWAEALREISSRLEEMPGEEGFPAYLGSHLGSFYERAGRTLSLGQAPREGSLTIIGAISPPGGDFSEPVTQASMRFAGAFWALDTGLAYRRHFPAISWQASYSLYWNTLSTWFRDEVATDMPELRSRLMALLQKEEEINEIAQIIGVEALQEKDRLTLGCAHVMREAFLRQNVFGEADAFASHDKQRWMLKCIFAFMDHSVASLEKGRFAEDILAMPLRTRLIRMPDVPSGVFAREAKGLLNEIEMEFEDKG